MSLDEMSVQSPERRFSSTVAARTSLDSTTEAMSPPDAALDAASRACPWRTHGREASKPRAVVGGDVAWVGELTAEGGDGVMQVFANAQRAKAWRQEPE